MKTNALPLLILFGTFSAHAQLAPVVFHDEQFDSGWSHKYTGTLKTSVTASLSPGISPDTRYLLTVIEGFVPPVKYRAYHYWTNRIYIPALHGPIASLEWEVKFRTEIGGHHLNLLARQEGSVYMSSRGTEWPQDNETWREHYATLSPTDFVRISGAGPDKPNFSTCGAPITFGYVNYNDTGIRGLDGVPGCPPGGCYLPGGAVGLGRFKLTINPQQIFRITEAKLAGPTDLVLKWETVVGQEYALEYTFYPTDPASWVSLLTYKADSCAVRVPITIPEGSNVLLRIRRGP